MKPIRLAVAYVIYNEDKSKFLIVKRPAEDENLPNVWGLPAGSVKEEESLQDAVIRSGREKLGVELSLLHCIGKRNSERTSDILYLEEYEVEIIRGIPQVPQSVPGITQYTEWKWGIASDLKEAAQKGSLCSQIYLKSKNLLG